MSNSSDFPLAVVASACEGAAALRSRLATTGVDTTIAAQLVGCSPLALARATKGGATPRGVLVGLAIAVTTIDRLAERGVTFPDLGRLPSTDEGVTAVADESPLAARMIGLLRGAAESSTQTQLAFDTPARAAA